MQLSSYASEIDRYKKIPVANNIAKSHWIANTDDVFECAVAALASVSRGTYRISSAPGSFTIRDGVQSITGKYDMRFPGDIGLTVWLYSDDAFPTIETSCHYCFSDALHKLETEIIEQNRSMEFSPVAESALVVKRLLAKLWEIAKASAGLSGGATRSNCYHPLLEELAWDIWFAAERGVRVAKGDELIAKVALARHASEICDRVVERHRELCDKVLLSAERDPLEVMTFGELSEPELYSLSNLIDRDISHWERNVKAMRNLYGFASEMVKVPEVKSALKSQGRIAWEDWVGLGTETGLGIAALGVLDGIPVEDALA